MIVTKSVDNLSVRDFSLPFGLPVSLYETVSFTMGNREFHYVKLLAEAVFLFDCYIKSDG